MAQPLLKPERKKPRTWFGYLPLWSECVPLNEAGKTDGVRVVANIIAGCVIGIRQTLSAIVSATLVFTSTDNETIVAMFPFGISMMWYSTLIGSAWYAIFGRLQYNTNATQEVCALLYGAMANHAAVVLADTPERIPPTILALIMTGTVVTGLCSLGLGKLGVGRSMLSFPAPVTSGFLGTIGFFLTRCALQITSGVTFQYFYPVSLSAFFSLQSMEHVACLLAMVALMRWGPASLARLFPNSRAVRKLGGLGCQLFPLALFYIAATALGVNLDDLSSAGWTYPAQGSQGFMKLWTTYDVREAEFSLVYSQWPQMIALVLMSVLCTMTGVLGITGKFPSGPDGDPNPNEAVDFDAELTTVGLGCVVAGLTNGVVTFHRLGSSVQLRLDGGTHRLGVLSSCLFVGLFFFSGAPLGHYIPKWFLGGLFMGSGISFMEGALLSYRSFPPSQYAVTVFCLLVAVFTSPVAGIGAGLALSIVIFLWDSASTSPVASLALGNGTMSRTKRPFWELRTLRKEGSRILVLYLQGRLFFGSGHGLAEKLVEVVEAGEGAVRYCILSFAKVPGMDTSAAQQLKAAVMKVDRLNCKVLFCRMKPTVFETLSSVNVLTSPDQDLRMVLEQLTKEVTVERETSERSEPEVAHEEGETHREQESGGHHLGLSPPVKRKTIFKPVWEGDLDGFDHETDALDYCGDKLLREFCYDAPNTGLEPYMLEYHRRSSNGERLGEDLFENMNLMPEGTLERIRPYCQVFEQLKPGAELRSEDGTLYFILKGSVTAVDVEDQIEVPHLSSARSVGVAVKGFYGRGGKRLRKRYPPGNIIGAYSFWLKRIDRLVDPGLVPRFIVSSKFSKTTEVWALKQSAWPELPSWIQRMLQEMVALQLADARQHTLLSGE